MPILPFLLVLVSPQKTPPSAEARRVGAAKSDLTTFRFLLLRFHRDTGRYPTLKEGLAVLTLRRPSIRGYRGPYAAKVSPDPWGNRYLYTPEGKGFSVLCYGSDGKEGGVGTAADLAVFED